MIMHRCRWIIAVIPGYVLLLTVAGIRDFTREHSDQKVPCYLDENRLN